MRNIFFPHYLSGEPIFSFPTIYRVSHYIADVYMKDALPNLMSV